MADQEVAVRDVIWDRIVPMGHLLRTFRLAIWPPGKLILCFLALAITVGAGVLLDLHYETNVHGQSFWANTTDVYRIATGFFARGWAELCLAPVAALWETVGLAGRYWTAAPMFSLWLSIITFLTWTFFGGAVSRLVALQFARDERIGVLTAVRFACRRYWALLTSPLALIVVVIIMAVAVCLPLSLVLLIPAAGEIAFGVLFFLLLIVGVLASVLLLFGLTSLALQGPVIAVEGRDAFDAVSRAVGYVVGHPWRYLFYTAFSLVYMGATFIFVRLFAFVALAIPHYAVSAWWWSRPDRDSFLPPDAKLDHLWAAPHFDELFRAPVSSVGSEHAASMIVTAFLIAFIGLVMAFLPAFFLTAQTIIYFLLRRMVDAKDLDEVCSDGEEEKPVAPLEKTDATTVEAEPAEGK